MKNVEDLPRNWLKFRYHGHKRYVTHWRETDGPFDRVDYIGFEVRKDGKFSNRIKRYKGTEMTDFEHGLLDENGNPEPALYSEVRPTHETPIYETPYDLTSDTWTINTNATNPEEFVIRYTPSTGNITWMNATQQGGF